MKLLWFTRALIWHTENIYKHQSLFIVCIIKVWKIFSTVYAPVICMSCHWCKYWIKFIDFIEHASGCVYSSYYYWICVGWNYCDLRERLYGTLKIFTPAFVYSLYNQSMPLYTFGSRHPFSQTAQNEKWKIFFQQ